MSLTNNNQKVFWRSWKEIVVIILAAFVMSMPASAQSLISGDIAGVVTDPSGAVIPAAAVTLKSLDTGAVQSTTTNASGAYRFSLLKPGNYSVSAAKVGFQTSQREVSAAVSQVVTADLALQIGQEAQTIQVTEAAAVLNPETSNNTAFSPREVRSLPSAGGDITNIAFTAPGVVVNVTSKGGNGNFSVNGLPGTSNLFTINGENAMDPYFNVNQTGATNLSLGQNDLEEATIITNAYSSQYGTFAGAQVNYITSSGTNEFHGDAMYYWNGRILNANDFFSNYYGDPRPFANANQWGTKLGGPIKKNKLFFVVNNEGLRFVLPDVQSVTLPTAAFANAVLSNIASKQPSELTTYQKMFSLWAGAPGASSAQPLANSSSCKSMNLAGFNPATQACAARYEAAPSALASEWILSTKIDYMISEKDTAFFRWKLDHGTQPTILDPISPAFNAISQQPSYDNQFSETHIFGPRSTNQFLASFSHYVAQFSQNHDLANSTFPYGIITQGVVPFTGFNPMYEFPQGRNITQYQFIDDATFALGSHDLKFGANFRRYDVSDHTFFYDSPTVYFGYTNSGLQQFVDGLAYQYRQSLNLANDVPIAMWGLGMYFNDDWHVKSNLKLTLGLRTERNSNPVCQFNCFANFTSAFSSLPSATNANPGSVPYSSDISYGRHQAFPGVDALDWSPRVGFSWSPGKGAKTVISGGFGIFYDPLSAGIVDNFLANPPVSVPIRVRPAAGVAPFDPGPKGGASIWQNSANAFAINETYAQISSSLKSLGSVFAQPSFTSVVGTMHAPMVEEWNLQVQRQLSSSMVLAVNYVGNHSSRIPYTNNWPNAYDLYQVFPGVPGIPAAAPDNNYGQVTQILSGAIANYDGLTATFRKQFSHGLTAHLNYTWSHALDEVSNGGIFKASTADSLLGQINPISLAANNYGNADYDIRHSFSADWVYAPAYRLHNSALNAILGGWQYSGKAFWRSGLPFSIIDGYWNGGLGNGGSTILATPLAGGGAAEPNGCGASAVNTPCLNANAFLNSGADSFTAFSGISPQTRNQYRGPHFFDMDMSLYKGFKLREGMILSVGVQAFNVFNHPNFEIPDNSLGDPTFGQFTSLVSSPTSPYGSLLGFNASPRVAQLSGKLVF